ncbi:MAG: MarR family transcriptional regulator [Nannocystis sp.]|nr:MarR family transcriptional regulator [Nannocystis sp.]
MRLLWAVDHGLHSTSKRMNTSIGVTGPQRLVLRMTGKFPGISAGELAQILHVHKSSLTGVLQRLEARGLLKRTADPEDGRRAIFSLTAKGKELDAVRAGTVEQAIRKVLGRVPKEQIEVTREVLQAVAAALAAVSQPASKR